MKLTQSLAFMITGGASFVIPFALAHFDLRMVVTSSRFIVGDALEACPGSSNFGCDCSAGGVKFSSSAKTLEAVGGNQTFFSVDSGLCGMGKLDLYPDEQSSGSWIVYESGGNGTIQGTCSRSTASLVCSVKHTLYTNERTTVDELLKCNSGICSAVS